MAHLSTVQVREQHVQVLGAELGGIYFALWNETVWLHFEWQQYLKLYAQTQEGVDALNEVAPAFFHVVQHTLREHVLLSLSRLTGSPRSAGQPNLTIRWLPLLTTDAALARELVSLIAALEPSWAFVTAWRNKHLAHRDLDVALERRAQPLSPVGRGDVDAALSSLREVMNKVEEKHFGSEVLYELNHSDDADALLHFLRLGTKVEAERIARLRAGEPLPGDFE